MWKFIDENSVYVSIRKRCKRHGPFLLNAFCKLIKKDVEASIKSLLEISFNFFCILRVDLCSLTAQGTYSFTSRDYIIPYAFLSLDCSK